MSRLLNRTSFVISSLNTELSASPMSTVLVVLDLVVSLHAEPWRNWAVLAGSLGQSDLCLEALLAWLFVRRRERKCRSVSIVFKLDQMRR